MSGTYPLPARLLLHLSVATLLVATLSVARCLFYFACCELRGVRCMLRGAGACECCTCVCRALQLRTLHPKADATRRNMLRCDTRLQPRVAMGCNTEWSDVTGCSPWAAQRREPAGSLGSCQRRSPRPSAPLPPGRSTGGAAPSPCCNIRCHGAATRSILQRAAACCNSEPTLSPGCPTGRPKCLPCCPRCSVARTACGERESDGAATQSTLPCAP